MAIAFKKKVISILIIIIILSADFVFMGYSKNSFETDNEIVTAVKVLPDLGIITEEITSDLTANMKRGEFCKIISNIINCGNNLTEISGLFSDLSEDTELARSCEFLYEQKMIAAYSNGTFMPDNDITYDEILKIIIMSLGYTQAAEARGGYPAGYYLTASAIGLKRFDSPSKYVTKEAVFKTLYSLFNVDVMGTEYISSATTYKVLNGVNIYEQNLNIFSGLGTVTENEYTTLSRPKDYIDNRFVINDILFKCENKIFGKYLGCNVRYYYKDVEDEKFLLSVIPANSVGTLTVDFEDVEENSDFSAIYYHKDGGDKISKINLNPLCDIIYNGTALLYSDKTSDIFKLIDPVTGIKLSGTFTLIDNNGDNSYDFMEIRASRTIAVDYIDYNRNVIYDKLNKNHPVIINEDDITVIVKNGSAVDLTAVNAGNIISINTNLSGGFKLRNIESQSLTFSGTITSVSEFENKIELLIDSKIYNLSPNYIEFLGNKAVSELTNMLNKPIVAYFDIFGKIAFIGLGVEADYILGYLAEVYPPKSEIDMSVAGLSVYTSDGIIKNYKTHDKIRVHRANSSKTMEKTEYKNYNDFIAVVSKGQVIRYKADENEFITDLYISEKVNITDGLYNFNEVYDYVINGGYVSTEPLSIRYTSSSFGSKIFVNDSTKVLIVYDEGERLKDFEWTVKGYFVEGITYNVSAYGLDETMLPELLVVSKKSSSGIDSSLQSNQLFLVDKVFSKVQDDEVVTAVGGMLGGTPATAIVTSDTKLYKINDATKKTDETSSISISEVKKGDVYQIYTVGKDNEIKFGVRLFNSSEYLDGNTNLEKAARHDIRVMLYGRVKKINGSSYVLDLGNPHDASPTGWMLRMTTKSISMWNVKSQTVSQATLNDIREGDWVLIRYRYSACTNVVIIRFDEL